MQSHVHISITEIDELEGGSLIILKGQIDESNLAHVKEKVDPLATHEMTQVLIFNFKDLEFINSKVIGYFLALYSEMEKSEKVIAVVEPNASIMNVLELVGLTTLFGHYETLEEALEALEA